MAQLVKNLPAMQETWVRSLGPIPGSGRFPGQGKDYTLQYSGLENSMDCIVYGVTKSRTRLSEFDSPLRSCVTLDELLNVSVLQFSHLQNTVCVSYYYVKQNNKLSRVVTLGSGPGILVFVV